MEIQSILKLTALGGLFPVYIHLFMLGWLTQLIFDVVFWMFPKIFKRKGASKRIAWLVGIHLAQHGFALARHSRANALNSAQSVQRMDTGHFCHPPIPGGLDIRDQLVGTRQGEMHAAAEPLVCARFIDGYPKI